MFYRSCRLKFNQFTLSAFLAGFSLMVVELVASRILAPLVGASLYTWTSVIGIILLGLVAGNFAGGYMIDTHKSILTVFYFYILAAVSVTAIPLLADISHPIIFFNFPLPVIILLLSSLIFFIPSFFLGGIYPCLYKFFVNDLACAGKSSALISAMWSGGSIIGTFLTGFVFISYLGSSHTLFIISGILSANALFLYIPKSKSAIIFLACAGLIIALAVYADLHQATSRNILYAKESAYYDIRILDTHLASDGNVRMMFLDFDAHSVERTDGHALAMYTNIPSIFPIFKTVADNILVIGGGSEAISKNFSSTYPDGQVTTIEIDPAVAQASKQFFSTGKSPTNTRISDGRIFLEKSSEKYDIIFSDAFNSFVSIPWHLSTKQFNDLVLSRLNGNGVYAVNIISAQTGDNSLFFQSLLKTFRQSFPNYHVFSFGLSQDEPQNVVLVGINSSDSLSDEAVRGLLLQNDPSGFFYHCFTPNSSLASASGSAPVLSDDFAPTERLMTPLMRNYFSKYSSMHPLLQ